MTHLKNNPHGETGYPLPNVSEGMSVDVQVTGKTEVFTVGMIVERRGPVIGHNGFDIVDRQAIMVNGKLVILPQ